jgi:hypothetical protein
MAVAIAYGAPASRFSPSQAGQRLESGLGDRMGWL